MRLHGRFGRGTPAYDGRVLSLSKYLGPALPAPFMAVDWLNGVQRIGVDWGMDGNDTLGDCTVAALAHHVMMASAETGKIVIPTDAECLAMYEVIGGYVPGNPATDNGATMPDALAYMQEVGLAGVKADAYCDINVADFTELKQSISLFGPAYIGVWLSQTDIDDFDNEKPWTDTKDKGNIGGHAIPIGAYDPHWYYVVTWGAIQLVSEAWLVAHMTNGGGEAHAVLLFDWIKASGLSPDGFALATLEADIKLVTA